MYCPRQIQDYRNKLGQYLKHTEKIKLAKSVLQERETWKDKENTVLAVHFSYLTRNSDELEGVKFPMLNAVKLKPK
jgi:hypothetical protein